MKKILPVAIPDITVYPHHAHLLSIFNGVIHNENVKLAWMCNNYLSLEMDTINNDVDFSAGFNIISLLVLHSKII